MICKQILHQMLCFTANTRKLRVWNHNTWYKQSTSISPQSLSSHPSSALSSVSSVISVLGVDDGCSRGGVVVVVEGLGLDFSSPICASAKHFEKYW